MWLFNKSRNRQQIDRIKNKLLRLKKLDHEYRIFGSIIHKYKIYPCLSEQEISLFEESNSIKLPAEYRLYLTEIGNGGAGPFYGLKELTDNDENKPDLTQPFMYTYNNPLSYQQSYEYMPEDLSDKEKKILMYTQAVRGIIFLSTEGCGLYCVLVVNGEAYGSIWLYDFANDAGIYPVINPKNKQPMQFLYWFEIWLDRSLSNSELSSYIEFIDE